MKDNFINFKKAINDMVATSENANLKSPSRVVPSGKETAAEVKTIVESGSYDQIIALSEKYFQNSGLYQRTLIYLSNLLTYDMYTAPKRTSSKTVNNKKYLEAYKAACFYADTAFLPQLNFPRMFLKMLIYGAYYGLVRTEGEKVILKDLLPKYCRSRFKSYNNIDMLEFDLSYFDSITDEVIKTDTFKREFSKDFEKAYREYKAKGQDYRWYLVPEEMGVVFYYQTENRPLMMAMLPAVANLVEYKDIEKNLDKQALEKILIQTIPLNKDGNYVLDEDEAAELHMGVVQMLSGSSYIDVLTTFAEVKVESLGDRTKADRDNLEKIERSVYNESGISKQLFASEGNQALTMSILTDMAMCLSIIKPFDNWLTFQVNLKYGENSKYFFEVCTLPITHYNRGDILEIYLKNAEFGYDKILPAIASGIKQSSFLDSQELQNELLKLHETMIPLASSHTGGATTDAGGAPAKGETKQSDKTAKNKEVKE